MNKDKNQTPSEVDQIDERVELPSAPITLENLVTQLTIALQNLRPKARQDLEVPKYDGAYPAQSFFETYDNQAGRAGLSASEKLDRLPLFLVQQPLQDFHQLRLDTRNYFQARDALLDLYPSTSKATYSKYFALRLQGQSLEEYYRTKTAMGLQLGLPQEAILEIYWDFPAQVRILSTFQCVIVAVYACGVDVEKGPIRQQLWNAPPCDNVEPWFGAQSRMIPGHLYFVFRAL
ncbi:hypothetical protein LAZ67_7001297 [Cordylochernes scorpioides]|uniref:Uncharacterized protein n=1 Tax=Cordylochernes scorpioides TaxID=51811 RepID=A0ABY6KML2_9ARAC|nr:hypothetical protein LAZ67_7001297 [Cordylochernes scorpioides]